MFNFQKLNELSNIGYIFCFQNVTYDVYSLIYKN